MREFKGNSIIALPSDYIVIDTETTGLDYSFCDIIEISALKFSNGQCVDKFTSLIQPPLRQFYSYFDEEHDLVQTGYVPSFIEDLTGITNEMLADAPQPSEVIPAFLEFIGDSILVGHNAHFDINFIYDVSLDVCGVPLKNDFIDTLRIARKVFPKLGHHRLSDVAEACSIEYHDAHRAEADCIITAACYAAMKDKVLATSTEEEFIDSFSYNYSKILSSISASTDNIDTTNPIYGKNIVFTGALTSLTRKEAFQVVADLGAIPQNSINAKTNYLVIGNSEFAQSVKEGKTNKMKKAEAMLKKGAEIAIISEAAFFDLIEDYK